MSYTTVVVEEGETAYECDNCGGPIHPGSEVVRTIRSLVTTDGRGRLTTADLRYDEIRHADPEECDA